MQANTLNLVGQIYDTVSEPERWESFLDNLAGALGAHAARMRMLDTTNDKGYKLIAGAGHDNAFDEQYTEHFVKVDPWNPILAKVAPGIVADSSELCTVKEFTNSEMYNDFWRQYEVFYGLGVNLIKTDTSIARIGIHRPRSQGTYTDQEKRLLQDLAPHLLRAFKLGGHLQSMQSQLEGMQEALYRSSSPLVLIDEYGQVAFTNQCAEALLSNESGLSVQNSRLTAMHEAEQSNLQRLLQSAVATGARRGTGSGGAMRLTSLNGKQRYNLLITPYPDRSVSHLSINQRICAAVFIHDTQQSGKLPADTLKTLYGLTRSEIRLAEGVVAGLTPAEAAHKYGVSINTTRTQLRSLFAKTNTQRQADLLRLLTGLIGR